MSDPAALFELARGLRTAIVQEFANDQVEIPSRREIVGHAVVADCEKLSVTWERVYVGQAGNSELVVPVNRGIMRSVILTVYLYRAITMPQGEGMELIEDTVPDVDDLEADAKRIMTDALTLHRGITRAHFAGEFTDFCTALSIGPATPLPAQGGLAGTTVQLQIELV